jgi:hypothetical protein
VKKVDASEGLPDHLVDLFERSRQGISLENKNSVLKLLFRYSKLFSKSDRDLGRTEFVKHTIETGGNVPIKQATR